MNIKQEDSYWVKLYIAGPIGVAEQLIREECWREGLCVTIEKTKFIYTGGEEEGYIVGFLNYPRFPKTSFEILNRAENICKILLDKTFQSSALIQTPEKAIWYSKREE